MVLVAVSILSDSLVIGIAAIGAIIALNATLRGLKKTNSAYSVIPRWGVRRTKDSHCGW